MLSFPINTPNSKPTCQYHFIIQKIAQLGKMLLASVGLSIPTEKFGKNLFTQLKTYSIWNIQNVILSEFKNLTVSVENWANKKRSSFVFAVFVPLELLWEMCFKSVLIFSLMMFLLLSPRLGRVSGWLSCQANIFIIWIFKYFSNLNIYTSW